MRNGKGIQSVGHPARQAQFVSAAYTAVVAAGGDGFLYFACAAMPGQAPPAGGYTEADAAAMEAAQQVVEYLNLTAGLDWLLGKHSLQELPRVAQIASASGSGFGLLRADFSARPALATLASLFGK